MTVILCDGVFKLIFKTNLIGIYLHPFHKCREFLWANYSTGLGAALHELSHTFDLAHTSTGIMARGFDDLYRALASCHHIPSSTSTLSFISPLSSSPLSNYSLNDESPSSAYLMNPVSPKCSSLPTSPRCHVSTNVSAYELLTIPCITIVTVEYCRTERSEQAVLDGWVPEAMLPPRENLQMPPQQRVPLAQDETQSQLQRGI